MNEQDYRQCLNYISKIWNIKFNNKQFNVSYEQYKYFSKEEFIECIRGFSYLPNCPSGNEILNELIKKAKNDKYWLGKKVEKGNNKEKIEEINDLLKEFD